MDINFHYAAVKVLACHAGLPPRESELIAYASQYVDDANAHRKMNLDRKPGVAGIRFAHGEFDPINPLFSSVKLVKDIRADGDLEASE